MIGVYTITHRLTQRFYVGHSIAVERRFKEHRNALRRGAHHCAKLQNSWNAHGEDLFEFRLLRECDTKQEAIEHEEAGLSLWHAKGLLFNVASTNDMRDLAVRNLHTLDARDAGRESRRRSPLALAALARNRLKANTPEATAKRLATTRRNDRMSVAQRRPVRATAGTGEVLLFRSVNEAARALGIKSKGNIPMVLAGKRPHTLGYRFEYA